MYSSNLVANVQCVFLFQRTSQQSQAQQARLQELENEIDTLTRALKEAETQALKVSVKRSEIQKEREREKELRSETADKLRLATNFCAVISVSCPNYEQTMLVMMPVTWLSFRFTPPFLFKNLLDRPQRIVSSFCLRTSWLRNWKLPTLNAWKWQYKQRPTNSLLRHDTRY